MQQKALKTSPHLLGAHDLTKSYGRHEVVKGVKFSVAQGEIVGLLGPNGAGKTTTFRMVVGMIRPDSGQISFRGRDITALPMYRRARLGMGYLAQEPSVFQGLTVLENIVAILEAIGVSRRERAKRANDSLEEFGLRHLSPREPTPSPAVRGAGSRSAAQWSPTLSFSFSTNHSQASTP